MVYAKNKNGQIILNPKIVEMVYTIFVELPV